MSDLCTICKRYSSPFDWKEFCMFLEAECKKKDDRIRELEARDKRVRNEALREAGNRLLELNQPARAETVFALIDADN